MEEKLFQEYVGKELREFILNEDNETINDRTVWVCVGNLWNLIYYTHNVLSLRHLGIELKNSLIVDIIADEMDISIVINNPFKGVD